MISHSIQIREPRNLFSTGRARPNLRVSWPGQLKRVTIPRIGQARIEGRGMVETILSIEDRIRRYVETQPAQLYRGGL